MIAIYGIAIYISVALIIVLITNGEQLSDRKRINQSSGSHCTIIIANNYNYQKRADGEPMRCRKC